MYSRNQLPPGYTHDLAIFDDPLLHAIHLVHYALISLDKRNKDVSLKHPLLGSPASRCCCQSRLLLQVHELGPELLADARSRLIAGLKRYFHAKRVEGLLSNKVSKFRAYH